MVQWKTGGSKCLSLLGFLVRRLDFVFLCIRALTCRLTAYCMLTEYFHDPGCWTCPVILCTKTHGRRSRNMLDGNWRCAQPRDGDEWWDQGGQLDYDLMRLVWDSGTKTCSRSIQTWLLFQNMPKWPALKSIFKEWWFSMMSKHFRAMGLLPNPNRLYL